MPLEALLLLVLLAAVLPRALQHRVRVDNGPRLPFHGRRWRWCGLLLLLLLLRFSLLRLLLIRAGISLPLLCLFQVVRPPLPLAGVLGGAGRSREVELVLLGGAALPSFPLPLRLGGAQVLSRLNLEENPIKRPPLQEDEDSTVLYN